MRECILCISEFAGKLVFACLIGGLGAGIAQTSSQPYTTCQIVQDGVTDDGPAINACLEEHPGRHIMLHKLGEASYGGGQATSKDIYSSQTITMVGDAQWLDCIV